jgi:hypothetical protein
MAMNEVNNKRQYTQYKRHVNESSERVNAQTVNKLQNDINVTQLDNTDIKDKAFEERVYTILENNLYCNSCSIDYFKTGEKINLADSSNICILPNTSQVSLKDNTESGEFRSVTIYSPYGSSIEMNDFFLVTSQEVPTGASIKYYLETHTGERWPIETNQIKLPLHLTKNLIGGFTLVAQFKPNHLNECPVLNGYGILYWDAQVEVNYGLTNPDLMRFP